MSRLASTKSLVRSLVTSEPRPDPHSRDDHDDSPSGSISPQERIKRVAARTMDLGRSFTARPRSPTLTLYPDSKRTLSLKRKDRGNEAQASQDQGQGNFSQEKCSRITGLLNPLKAIITLCLRSLMDHKPWIMHSPRILLRLSRTMTHPSSRLHHRRLHLHGPSCSLFGILVPCVSHILFIPKACLVERC